MSVVSTGRGDSPHKKQGPVTSGVLEVCAVTCRRIVSFTATKKKCLLISVLQIQSAIRTVVSQNAQTLADPVEAYPKTSGNTQNVSIITTLGTSPPSQAKINHLTTKNSA